MTTLNRQSFDRKKKPNVHPLDRIFWGEKKDSPFPGAFTMSLHVRRLCCSPEPYHEPEREVFPLPDEQDLDGTSSVAG